MSYLKRRVAIFLCMVMAFTAVFCVMPQEQAQAASKVVFSWTFGNYSSKTKEAEIELGAEDLYIGDYVYAYTEGADYKYYGYLSLNSGVTYKSSNKNVIAVDKKGRLTAKKTGTATISIKFKGVTGKCKLKVVNSLASARESMTGYEAGTTACQEFVSAYGTGITNKNLYTVLKAYKNYKKNYTGAIYTQYNAAKYTYQICNPIAGRADVLASAAQRYGEDRNPLSTRSGKCFKVKSITGQGTKVTITLKSKATEENLVGIQFAGVSSYYDEMIVNKTSTVEFPMYLIDKKGNYKTATATIKKGSNKITVKTPKLTKGQTYTLVCYLGGWLVTKDSGNKNTFKAK